MLAHSITWLARMTFTYLCLFLTLHVFTVKSEGAADWCYEIQKLHGNNNKGPRDWDGECTGTKQSPINVVTRNTKFDSNLKPFHFTGYETSNRFVLSNNGHSAKLLLEGGQNIEINGGGLSGTYKASQLHLHWGSSYLYGSEHSIDGERYPIELHIVHTKVTGRSESTGGSTTTESGANAVLGFFFEETESENEKYKGIIEGLSKIGKPDMETNVTNVILKELIPEEKYLEHFYRYDGSLTTPPCSQTVTWTLFPQTIKLGKKQIEAFYKSLNYTDNVPMTENFRLPQKLGDRTVYTSGVEAVLSHSAYLLLSLMLAYVVSES